MIEFLSIGFAILMLKAAIFGIIIGVIFVQVHERGFLMTFVASAIYAHFTVSGVIPYVLVTISPMLLILSVAVIWGIVSPPLEKRGYLGKQKQWSHQMNTEDPYLKASLTLLSQEKVNEVASLSANAQDYKQNLIRAAGLDGHEIPDDF